MAQLTPPFSCELSDDDVPMQNHFKLGGCRMHNAMIRHTFAKGILSATIAILLVGMALAIAPVRVVYAATITVTSPLDSGPNTLRQAIIDANSGDTIDFSLALPNTITLTSGELLIDKNLTITGPGWTLAISGNNASRVFRIGSSATVTITELTITDGYSGDNFFDSGGGIYNEGTLTLQGCLIWQNETGVWSGTLGAFGADGGGIYNGPHGILELNGCAVAENQTGGGTYGGYGGGIYNHGVVTIIDSTVTLNRTGDGTEYAGRGGGIATYETMVILSSTINHNMTGVGTDVWSLGASGGGIAMSGQVAITNSTISNNSVGSAYYGGDGGGIHCQDDSELTLNYCTIAYNQAGEGGDGGDGQGGGVFYDADDSVHSRGSIIANNTVPAGSSGPNFAGELVSHGCNLIGDAFDGWWYNQAESFTAGDILGVDPLLEPLASNGGATETHSLGSGSPAIDGMRSFFCYKTIDGVPLLYDQRGESRPMDGNLDGVFLWDLGAYEADGPLNPTQGEALPPELPEPEEGDGEVAVGGTVQPIPLLGLGEAAGQQPGGESTNTSFALWAGLASGLAIVGGLLALRRRRAH